MRGAGAIPAPPPHPPHAPPRTCSVFGRGEGVPQRGAGRRRAGRRRRCHGRAGEGGREGGRGGRGSRARVPVRACVRACAEERGGRGRAGRRGGGEGAGAPAPPVLPALCPRGAGRGRSFSWALSANPRRFSARSVSGRAAVSRRRWGSAVLLYRSLVPLSATRKKGPSGRFSPRRQPVRGRRLSSSASAGREQGQRP